MLTWTIAGSTMDMAGFEDVCDVDDIGFGVASVPMDVIGVSWTLFSGVFAVGGGWGCGCGYEAAAAAVGCCCCCCCCGGTCCCGVDVGTIFKSCICEPLTISISWNWTGPPGGQIATKSMHEYIDVLHRLATRSAPLHTWFQCHISSVCVQVAYNACDDDSSHECHLKTNPNIICHGEGVLSCVRDMWIYTTERKASWERARRWLWTTTQH